MTRILVIVLAWLCLVAIVGGLISSVAAEWGLTAV